MTTWLIAAGDFLTYGGMDAANYGLARYLSTRDGDQVHLVAHRVADDLMAHPRVRVHRARRPFGAHRLGEPLLRKVTAHWAAQLRSSGARVIANGGNVDAGDVSWVHYVHAAYAPVAHARLNHLIRRLGHRRYVVEERRALRRARLVICNSQRTVDDVVRLAGVDPGRARVVYYGIDVARFRPSTPSERDAARRALGIVHTRPIVLFAGALGDRRKGFDTLFAAWQSLCRCREWDADLVVAGSGAELRSWQARAADSLPPGRVRFLDYQRDMRGVFGAGDVLVHPARYEAYGLAVHEALCCGLPAIVSATAGIAERYPGTLTRLLLHEPDSAAEVAARLRAWREDSAIAEHAAAFGAHLRRRSWDDMGREIAQLVEAA